MENEQSNIPNEGGVSKKNRYIFGHIGCGNDKCEKKKMRKSIILVVLGSVIYSFGVVWLLQLGGYFSGGVTGVSQLIVGLIEKFGGSTAIRGYIGLFVAIINIPLLMIGWRGVSKHFAILTVVSIAIQSILMSLISNVTVSPFIYLLSDGGNVGGGLIDAFKGDFNILHNPTTVALENAFRANMQPGTRLLLAIIGGLITGYGAALCLKGGGSTGGMDIISNYLVMKKRIPFTKYQFLVDISIICASSLIIVENVLYTIIRLIIYMKVLQAMYQTYQTTRLEIITDKADELKKVLLEHFYHSMTIYDAVGGYTNKCKKVIEIYAINFEIPEYMALIHSVDPKAFIITTKVKMIHGNYVQRSVV